MLTKECEGRLGKPPCDYAIIALGSVARMEATPFSDLEFAILYSDPAIGDKINYFRVMSHFLHLKVINLGETILPALSIQELNDFQSSDPNSNWFYDSGTPRGISFDGAMPWASKTALGRMATKHKPELELIRTPEGMAEFQDEEIAVKEGYHLAEIMSRVALLYGDQALLNEYNERVAEKLNAKSSKTGEKSSSKTVGVIRGMRQMVDDVQTYHPFNSYLGHHCNAGALFDTKKQFYRLISLLVSDLGMIFDVRSPSPWQVISELQARGIISVPESLNIKVCISIANEIRLKTYFANNGQKELFSPVPEYGNTTTEESADIPIFRDFDEDILVRLLSTSNNLCLRCHVFCLKWIKHDHIDDRIFQNPYFVMPKAVQMGHLYFRLQNFHKSLEWMKSAPKDRPYYASSLSGQGKVYLIFGEYAKSIGCFEEALQFIEWDEYESGPHVISWYNDLAYALLRVGKYKMARMRLEEAVCKHNEMYNEGSKTVFLSGLMQNLGVAYGMLGDTALAVETYNEVREINKGLTKVPDAPVIYLNIHMAFALSELGQHAQSLEYIERALQLSHKVFGANNLSIHLADIYHIAAVVYGRCNLNDKAVSLFKRSLELYKLLFGDKPYPGKMMVLGDLGQFFAERCQTNKAVENLEAALKLARAVYRKNPQVFLAKILNDLGTIIGNLLNAESVKNFPPERLGQSLLYFQEAKEIMDEILGPGHAHPYTSNTLNNMGAIYLELDDLSKALQCFKDAFNINSVIYVEDSICGNMTSIRSNIAYTLEKMGFYNEAKDYYIKAVKIARKMSLNKKTCSIVLVNLYRISLICEEFGERDEELKHLEEARKISKETRCKEWCKEWVMVCILVQLMRKYAMMGSIVKSIVYYLEAREMAKSLPTEDFLPQLIMDVLKLMEI
ncbi:uncharacterized protein LOC114533329 [Dendronephthya gigantea]|uniref:uncharacterized protein LOC114533329 n=1 Tax=Dendronephthya gigantea TaxID=151771 RepID=UPI00106D8A4A|nr:uncharacterized protein LOC114533329 [Dendronephthya gigantea]